MIRPKTISPESPFTGAKIDYINFENRNYHMLYRISIKIQYYATFSCFSYIHILPSTKSPTLIPKTKGPDHVPKTKGPNNIFQAPTS